MDMHKFGEKLLFSVIHSFTLTVVKTVHEGDCQPGIFRLVCHLCLSEATLSAVGAFSWCLCQRKVVRPSPRHGVLAKHLKGFFGEN